MKRTDLNRRELLGVVAAGAAAFTASVFDSPDLKATEDAPAAAKGRIRQSVCQWCYGKMSVDDLAKNSARIGLKSVELIGPDHWPTIRKYGLICAMVPSHPLHKGLNHKDNWDECLAKIRTSIELSAEAGFPNVITFSGNRNGVPDDVGIENCVAAVKKVIGLAEEKKINLCMELLNSKVNHKDYQCDRTPWGVEVVKRVGSPRFKLLYDIYHMQIMEGDVIRTIRENHQYLGHYHTGGNPGRNEIDDTQELNYAAIMKAIVETKFEGYVGQEFIPLRDPMTSLAQSFKICDV